MELIKINKTLLAKFTVEFIRISLGIVYLWFVVLKFFPNTSPAEIVAQKTMDKPILGFVATEVNYCILAIIETVFGLFLLSFKGNITDNSIKTKGT